MPVVALFLPVAPPSALAEQALEGQLSVRQSPSMIWLSRNFELGRGGDHDNLRPMEGLRGFAVALVFLVHYATLTGPWTAGQVVAARLVSALQTIGNTGVDLFFVLSGYLIYGSLMEREQAFPTYFRRRLRRLYPAFSIVFLVYVLLSLAMPSQSKIPLGAGAASLYLVQNFMMLPGLLPIEPMIVVAWSLSYEVFYYLVLPAVISVVGLRSRSSAWRVGFFVVTALLFAGLCAWRGGHIRLIMFAVGILLHEALRHRFVRAPGSRAAWWALGLGLGLTLQPFVGSLAYTLRTLFLAVAFFVLCHNCFAMPRGGVAIAFSWAPLRWLGNMSYSYYLLHSLPLKAAFLGVAMLLPVGSVSPLWWLLMLPPMLLLTILPSALLFLAVERPFSLAPARRRVVPA